MHKEFYDQHKNFSYRTATEYDISPGIKCKFDLIKANLGSNRIFNHGIDLGSSGNSILTHLDNIELKSFFDIASLPLYQYINEKGWHPLCGDLINLPYRNNSIDFISALDVLEHIKKDQLAVSEMSRVLKKNGLAIITVPHRMKYYTYQDKLIGHCRRYEVEEIITLFNEFNLKHLKTFGVYGQLMRISDVQSTNPSNIEKNISSLRFKYENNHIFRKIWDLVVNNLTKLMRVDAKYQPLKRIMNIAFIFKKI
ncbi:MAG: class I SAM-dependent methyltransferase [Promethearchaeota archaeon]|jgi:SAM-dependent methyltransferase